MALTRQLRAITATILIAGTAACAAVTPREAAPVSASGPVASSAALAPRDPCAVGQVDHTLPVVAAGDLHEVAGRYLGQRIVVVGYARFDWEVSVMWASATDRPPPGSARRSAVIEIEPEPRSLRTALGNECREALVAVEGTVVSVSSGMIGRTQVGHVTAVERRP